jgi:tricorn protease
MPRTALRVACALAVAILSANEVGAAPPADPIRFMRDPAVGHGRLAFSYMGDIWVADMEGRNARRVTHHVARDVAPSFSPDGRWLAFSSNRMGNYDVYVMPIDGGEPRQLTWHAGDDQVQGWLPDSRGIVFATARGTHAWGSPLHVASLDGSIPTPLPMDMARAGMVRQDGSMIAFNRLNMSATRKGYRGNNSTDVWVQDLGTKAIRQLTDTNLEDFKEHVQDGQPMWGADGMIYFVSERSGIYNLWRIAAEGGAPQQFTRHESGGVKYPSISPDGGTIVYTQDYELWTVDVPSGTPRKVVVDVEFDPQDNLVEYIDVRNRAEGFAPAPGAEQVAVDSRGEIFLVPADEALGEKTQVTRSPWRERHQQYSPDGTLLGYVSDESGDEEIWVYDVAAATKRRLTTHASQKTGFTWSPDGARIAFVGSNRLFEVDVASGRTTELGYNIAGGYSVYDYSADGKWLVLGRSDEDQNPDIYLFDIAARREVDVTRNPFRDAGAALTPDGRTLVFASNRDDGTNHLFAVSLTRMVDDPEDPLVRARLQQRTRADSAANDTAAAAAEIRVDGDGIERRARQLTTGSNAVGSFFLSRDGRTVYFTSTDDDGPGLFSIGLDGRDRRRVVAGSFPGITPTPDRRFVFYRGSGPDEDGADEDETGGPGAEVWRMALTGNNRKERIAFTFPIVVDVRGEWKQIFGESWRVMKYRFYDEKMHGRDWDAIRRAYEPLVAHVGTYEDLYDLANHMIGELNASHVGVSGPPSRPAERAYQTRYLGFELEPADGRYRVSHVYRDGPADREWLDVAVGDYVLAIDGQEVRPPDNYWRILNHALNEYVPVRIAKTANGDGARDVRIRTVTSLTNIKYEEWVAKNREMVEKESNGEIAYVHIRAMNQPSLERFENEIDQFWNRKGIVVDIRYNGGGNIDQQLIDILERQPYQFWNSRWGARTWGRRPRQAIAGPKVMLTNHRSGSDSEVTPTAFRQLGLGRIVGNPTAAAVIATGSYALIHGGSIRTPGSLVVTWDPTKPNNYGYNLENHGVPPDVWAENTPEDELRGFDRELKAAIDEALRMLREGRWQYTTTDGTGSGRN